MTYDSARYSTIKDAKPRFEIVDNFVHVKIGPAHDPDVVVILTSEQAIEIGRHLISLGSDLASR